MAWECWTDGHDDGSLAPQDGGLRRCLCGRYFLIGDAMRVRTIFNQKPAPPKGWEGWKDNWWSRFLGRPGRQEILERYDIRPIEVIEAEQRSIPPGSEYVTCAELRSLIDSNVADARIMEIARRRYWRFLNEPFREVYRNFRETHKEVGADGNSITFPDFSPSSEQTQNMAALVKLLTVPGRPVSLELAELYRELGDMEAAEQALNGISGEKEKLHLAIEKLVALKVRCSVRLT